MKSACIVSLINILIFLCENLCVRYQVQNHNRIHSTYAFFTLTLYLLKMMFIMRGMAFSNQWDELIQPNRENWFKWQRSMAHLSRNRHMKNLRRILKVRFTGDHSIEEISVWLHCEMINLLLPRCANDAMIRNGDMKTRHRPASNVEYNQNECWPKDCERRCCIYNGRKHTVIELICNGNKNELQFILIR